jgi:hypothetical protein
MESWSEPWYRDPDGPTKPKPFEGLQLGVPMQAKEKRPVTDLSVSEIACKLCFDCPQTFSELVKWKRKFPSHGSGQAFA